MKSIIPCRHCAEPIIFATFRGRCIALDADAGDNGYFDVTFGAEPFSDNYATSVRVANQPDPRVQSLHRPHACKKNGAAS